MSPFGHFRDAAARVVARQGLGAEKLRLMKTWSLIIDRSDLSSTALVDAATMRPTAGQALLQVERVGLTTNNLTCCALGDALRYWDYFRTQIPGMAHIPLWGYAEVVAPGP